MRRLLLWAFVGMLALGGPVAAQTPACPAPACQAAQDDAESLWLSADYLLWWIRKGPVPPIVSTGPLGVDPFAGALDQPNTRVLYGGSGIDFGTFSGVRLSAGAVLDRESGLGVEGGYTRLESRSDGFARGSDANGNPYFGRPFVNGVTGNENVYFVAFPNDIRGDLRISASSQFWDFDVNGTFRLYKGDALRVTGLVGFRRTRLAEDLHQTETISQVVPGLGAVNFAGVEVNPPGSISILDRFAATNNFYGGQLGARFDWQNDRLSVNVLTKVGIGVTRQQVQILGASTLVAPGVAPVNVPGGIYAQAGNIGSYSRSVFGVVPEVGLNVGYRLTQRFTVRAGYTVVYWSDVARPGDQLDRSINVFRVPTDGAFGAAGGPNRPAFAFKGADFLAHGVNFGVEYRY